LSTACQTASEEDGRHSCCHLDHVHCEADTLARAESQADRPDSEQPVEDHESDRCSICQSFFTSRHAIVLASDVTFVKLLTVRHDVVLTDEVFAADPLSRSHTVRGPPSV
jgi:hypothetical protein